MIQEPNPVMPDVLFYDDDSEEIIEGLKLVNKLKDYFSNKLMNDSIQAAAVAYDVFINTLDANGETMKLCAGVEEPDRKLTLTVEATRGNCEAIRNPSVYVTPGVSPVIVVDQVASVRSSGPLPISRN